MSVVTRNGDSGYTSLFGNALFKKTEQVFDLLGGVDELNTYINLIRNELISLNNKQIVHFIGFFESLNVVLYKLMGDIAAFHSYMNGSIEWFHENSTFITTDEELLKVEKTIEALEKFSDKDMQLLKNVNKSLISCKIDYARALVRRCERESWKYTNIVMKRYIDENEFTHFVLSVSKYFNRLSDLLYVVSTNKVLMIAK